MLNGIIALNNLEYSKLQSLDTHAHSAAKTYPELAASITLTKGSGAWAAYPSSKTEIVPVNTITSVFDIHGISVDTISANGNYTITLYSGTAGNEVAIGVRSFTRTAASTDSPYVFFQTPKQAANTRISAAISSANAGTNTCNIKIDYHVYS